MKIRYTENIILFLDVLGFSNLVYNKDKAKIEDFFSYVESEFHSYLTSRKINYIIISDSIVVSTKKTKENLSELLFIISKIQYQLFLKGILVRGGISFGKLYINKTSNIIVGPGLINAYRLESIAKYPRIIIDRQLIPELFESTSTFVSYLNKVFFEIYGETDGKVKFDKTSNDGKPYINFMRMLVRYGPTYKPLNIKRITDLFRNNYYNNEHFDKYNWLLEELKQEMTLGIQHYESNSQLSKAKSRIRDIKLLQSHIDKL